MIQSGRGYTSPVTAALLFEVIALLSVGIYLRYVLPLSGK
jgi:hypothetical protein